MVATSRTRSALLALLAGTSLVQAHGAIFGDFAFGSVSGGISDTPLTQSLSLKQWFFRGLTPASAKGSLTLNPGKTATLNVACSQDSANRGQMCAEDPGSLHLTSSGKGSGCALLISYKDFDSIRPEDMTVFSVLHDCPKADSKRVFAIPSNLPAGDATCAFHWVPPEESSQDEQYMTGFKCTVSGSTKGQLAATGNQKPLYWAAQGVKLPSKRPQYDEIADGAQRLVLASGSSTASSDSGSDSTSTSTSISNSKGAAGSSRTCSTASRRERQKRHTEGKRRLHVLRRRLAEEMRALGVESI